MTRPEDVFKVEADAEGIGGDGAADVGGLVLMVLPKLIAGNEPLILGGVALAVGWWFLAHRHGQLRGTVAAQTPSPKQPS